MVYKELSLSPYKVKYNDMIFYFSSRQRKLKFETSLRKAIIDTNNRLSIRYRANVNIPILGVVRLYYDVEKLGCYILKGDKVIDSWQKIKINNGKLSIS